MNTVINQNRVTTNRMNEVKTVNERVRESVN